MFDHSNNLLEDLQEKVATATDGDGAWFLAGAVVFCLLLKGD
jgi:hypothetical protein